MVVFVGCMRRAKNPEPIQPPPVSAERLSYQHAIKAYNEGQYNAAAQLFDSIRATTVDHLMARLALYGLACARMMAAESPRAYQEALQIWQAWVAGAPSDDKTESPLLMVPLIKEKAFFANIPLTGSVPNEIQENKIVPLWKLLKAKQDLELVRQQLEESDRAKKSALKRIGALEKEIEELTNQLKALETIDQKIQKKKSAIPSTD
jgi:hypothetical protein